MLNSLLGTTVAQVSFWVSFLSLKEKKITPFSLCSYNSCLFVGLVFFGLGEEQIREMHRLGNSLSFQFSN